LLGAGCEGADSSSGREDKDGGNGDAPGQSSNAPMPHGDLFGSTVSSYVTVRAGVVATVGVVVPLASIAQAPEDGPFQNDLILNMPPQAREQTMLSQLRINWLAHGHGPTPYSAPHFDLHFYRGTNTQIDAIDCTDSRAFPASILTSDHADPSTCVAGMGFHSWPSADLEPGAAFTASLILGYYDQRIVFIEPMIAKSTLLSKQDFELAVSRPQSSGGAPTLYPTRMRGIYDAPTAGYRFEFDKFEPID
jgi:hypothetical protein